MKVNGIKLDAPRIVKVYLPIANDGAVEFKFRPLRSDEDFEKVLSKPKPKVGMAPGGAVHHKVDDPAYKLAIASWINKKLDWEFLTSISVTDGLEWSTVDIDKPETWGNWRTDLEKIFAVGEINKVFEGFLNAQYISEEVMEKARATFLTGIQAQSEALLFPTEEVLNTLSGEPAKDSVSVPQG